LCQFRSTHHRHDHIRNQEIKIGLCAFEQL
jgi:hypothetical protein